MQHHYLETLWTIGHYVKIYFICGRKHHIAIGLMSHDTLALPYILVKVTFQ